MVEGRFSWCKVLYPSVFLFIKNFNKGNQLNKDSKQSVKNFNVDSFKKYKKTECHSTVIQV